MTLGSGEALVALATAASEEEGKRIAHALVSERLAACVNVVPRITSVYTWKGAVEESSEVMLVVKTTQAAFARMKARLVELHSYDVPECIALRVLDGHAPYLAWIQESVT